MNPGKLPPEMMEKLIFPFKGKIRSEVIVGPQIGEDAAVIDIGNRYLIVTSDPIIGTDNLIGYFLVHINANDIASKGGIPAYMTVTVAFPQSAGEKDIRNLMKEIDTEARKLGIAIVGGHTEITTKFNSIVASGTMIGYADRVMSLADVNEGDIIILTKSAGLEGTSIIVSNHTEQVRGKLSEEEIKEAVNYVSSISVVKEALIAREKAVFMHDPTEGGIVGGLSELESKSKLNIEVDWDSIPVTELTKKVCSVFNIDPLHLISSGALLIVVHEADEKWILSKLQNNGIRAKSIGRFTSKKGNLIPSYQEELWKVMKWGD